MMMKRMKPSFATLFGLAAASMMTTARTGYTDLSAKKGLMIRIDDADTGGGKDNSSNIGGDTATLDKNAADPTLKNPSLKPAGGQEQQQAQNAGSTQQADGAASEASTRQLKADPDVRVAKGEVIGEPGGQQAQQT